MAYLGVIGPHACGKTTAFEHIVSWLRNNRHLPTVVVNCDNNRERQWWDGKLEEEKHKGSVVWVGTVEDKAAELEYCVQCDRAVWLCESVRTDHIRLVGDIWKDIDYGLAEFVVLTCKPDTLKQFLIDRNAKSGRKFNAEYWIEKRLVYESSRRYLGSAKKYLDPVGIPWAQFEIDYERENWDVVLEHIEQRLEELSSKL